MTWDLEEAIAYYKHQGAPRDQNALIALLGEIQQELGGIPMWALTAAAQGYAIRESVLLALIRRVPRLRLEDTHTLEVCAGPSCGRHAPLASAAEELRKQGVTVKFVPCMGQCGKGPNIRWDGKLYHGADASLLKSLLKRSDLH